MKTYIFPVFTNVCNDPRKYDELLKMWRRLKANFFCVKYIVFNTSMTLCFSAHNKTLF